MVVRQRCSSSKWRHQLPHLMQDRERRPLFHRVQFRDEPLIDPLFRIFEAGDRKCPWFDAVIFETSRESIRFSDRFRRPAS